MADSSLDKANINNLNQNEPHKASWLLIACNFHVTCMEKLASFCKNSKLLPPCHMIDSFDELIDRPFLVPDGCALGFLGLRDFA